jgi:hypothetical protein
MIHLTLSPDQRSAVQALRRDQALRPSGQWRRQRVVPDLVNVRTGDKLSL